MAIAISGVASNCAVRGESTKSIKLYEQAIGIFRRLGDLEKESETMTEYSNYLSVIGDHTNSRKNCREAISMRVR